MAFEQCEIRADHYGPFIAFLWKWDIKAQVTGPHGSYVIARTGKFSPSHDNLYWLIEREFEVELVNKLTEFLINTGWELLPESGVHWYSRKFRRDAALYLPDPDRAHPYILGDEEVWRKKVLKTANRYERRKDVTSCREFADSLMRFGLALERTRELEDAFEKYVQAAMLFKQINAFDEAAKASDWAQRVSHQGQRRDKPNATDNSPSEVANALEELEKAFRKTDEDVQRVAVRTCKRPLPLLWTSSRLKMLLGGLPIVAIRLLAHQKWINRYEHRSRTTTCGYSRN